MKVIPGYLYYLCDECGFEWKEENPDCLFPHASICPMYEKGECKNMIKISPYKKEKI